MTPQNSILIVDDEDRLRLSLSLILQKENFRVETAANAEEALKHLQSHEYDLMFLDLNLPGMSGIDLLVEVHKRAPHMLVLILTAHAALESAIQAVRLGARDAGPAHASRRTKLSRPRHARHRRRLERRLSHRHRARLHSQEGSCRRRLPLRHAHL